MYTYRCHDTKHVHVHLSQYKTCTRTAVTTKHVRITLGFANINAYFQDTGLQGCCAVETSNFSFMAIRRQETVCIYIRTVKYYLRVHFIDVCPYSLVHYLVQF
jgi:hypothetical protein